MALSQDAFIGIFAAILAADIIVIVVALLWSRVPRADRARVSNAAASVTGRRNQVALATNGGYSNGNGNHGAASMSIGARVGAVAPTLVDPTIDELTGLLVPSAWSRLVADEDARVNRYHRPVTIVMIELEGLDKLAERMGPAAIERIVPAVADTLRRGAREADHIARLGTGRFAVMMPETDEVLAINYVERVRRACELWLEAGAVALHLAMGWASTGGDGTMADVETAATSRMFIELRRKTRSSATETAGSPDDPPLENGGMAPAFGR
jgi:diguanylate cyclase (GGDEF)-like protein